MTLQSIYSGEGYFNNPSNFVYVVINWAHTQNLPGLKAWISEFPEYSCPDQAQILIDWIDKYCNSNEVESCIRFLTDMNENIVYNDDIETEFNTEEIDDGIASEDERSATIDLE